ncbi:TPA: type IV secretory system conjugative DNA transfer family protein [Yersinia enterocolitica]
MIGKIHTSLLAACLALTQLQAHAADPEISTYIPPTLNQVVGFNTNGRSEPDTVRIGLLRDMGETLGFRAGLAYQAHQITSTLRKHEVRLDRIFQFAPLISRDGALPPVIVEANDVASITPDQIRTANKVFDILKPEEFVSVPPTWRDYLYTGLMVEAETDFPGEDAKPKSSTERKAWNDAVTAGWGKGSEQADQILAANFNRIVRDYTGMMRYSSLLKQGMVSKTQVAASSSTISTESSKTKLMIGERHQQIIRKAEFQTDPNKWTPIVTKTPGTSGYTYGSR